MAVKTWNTSNSSRITQIEHDDETQKLVVTFKRGGAYEYSNVDVGTYQLLIAAESVGKAFEELIKNFPATYPFTKLS